MQDGRDVYLSKVLFVVVFKVAVMRVNSFLVFGGRFILGKGYRRNTYNYSCFQYSIPYVPKFVGAEI